MYRCSAEQGRFVREHYFYITRIYVRETYGVKSVLQSESEVKILDVCVRTLLSDTMDVGWEKVASYFAWKNAPGDSRQPLIKCVCLFSFVHFGTLKYEPAYIVRDKLL